MKSAQIAGGSVGHLAQRSEGGVVAERGRQPGPAPELLARVELGPAGEDRRRSDPVGPVAERSGNAGRRGADIRERYAGAVEHDRQQLARCVQRALGVAVDVELSAFLGQDLPAAGGDGHVDVAVTEVESGDEAVRPVQREQRRRSPAARPGASAARRCFIDQPLMEQFRDQRSRRAPRQADRARQLRAADRALVADHCDQVST